MAIIEAGGYQQQALKILSCSSEPLLMLLFSEQNINYIQEQILNRVESNLGASDLTRDIFLKLLQMYSITRSNRSQSLKVAITEINRRIVSDTLRNITTGVEYHNIYTKRHYSQYTPPPAPHPVNVHSKGPEESVQFRHPFI